MTEVSTATDLVTGLDDYESRLIRVTGVLNTFASAGTGFVGSQLTRTGITAPSNDLRLRIPTEVQDYDLVQTCSVTVDYGVMWRFNADAQPSVYSADDLDAITCPAPTVASAAAIASTHVAVTFDRKVAAATATTGRFTFDNGLTASAVSVDGSAVTLTTGTITQGVAYTVTVSPQVTDVLGTGVGTPSTATFQDVQLATLALNEINPNIGSSHDLIELLALTSGNVLGLSVVQRGTANETLTF